MHNTYGVGGIVPSRTLTHIDTGKCGNFFRLTGYTKYPVNIEGATCLAEVEELLKAYGPFHVDAYSRPIYHVTVPKKTFSEVGKAIEYLIQETPYGSVGTIKNNTDILCHYDCT